MVMWMWCMRGVTKNGFGASCSLKRYCFLLPFSVVFHSCMGYLKIDNSMRKGELEEDNKPDVFSPLNLLGIFHILSFFGKVYTPFFSLSKKDDAGVR
jgi:hypothetical protein